MFSDEPEFEKKMLIMSVKYETFMCELFGVFFF